jgi:hypothetical protein
MPTRSTQWGLSGLYQSDVQIFAPELKNLVSAPVTLIPTPGRGRAILIVQIAAVTVFGTTPFVNPGRASAGIFYDGPNKVLATGPLASPLSLLPLLTGPQNAAGNFVATSVGAQIYSLFSDVVDRGVIVGNETTEPNPQNLTGGDGSIKVAVLYTVVQTF